MLAASYWSLLGEYFNMISLQGRIQESFQGGGLNFLQYRGGGSAPVGA